MEGVKSCLGRRRIDEIIDRVLFSSPTREESIKLKTIPYWESFPPE